MEDGECLTALVLQPQLAAAKSAFALWCHGDSTITTWGDVLDGGNSAAVRDQLRGVQKIQATGYAFAAIVEDGSVITWEALAVTVQQFKISWRVCSRFRPHTLRLLPFLEDGSVITSGDAEHGGDSSPVRDQLTGVQQIQATVSAFAAILEDGSVVTWGNADAGGDSSAVQMNSGLLSLAVIVSVCWMSGWKLRKNVRGDGTVPKRISVCSPRFCTSVNTNMPTRLDFMKS